MSFISESQLSSYRRRTKVFSADDIINLNESYYRTRPMVFLSHKHDEQETLQDVVAFLKQEGVDVYVDWMDSSMPAYTNAGTAHSLKQKIKAADKFILVATPSAINSKWCNWELGLGDAAKYKEHGNNKYIDGRYIQRGYYVKYKLDNGNTSLTPLKDWLKSK